MYDDNKWKGIESIPVLWKKRICSSNSSCSPTYVRRNRRRTVSDSYKDECMSHRIINRGVPSRDGNCIGFFFDSVRQESRRGFGFNGPARIHRNRRYLAGPTIDVYRLVSPPIEKPVSLTSRGLFFQTKIGAANRILWRLTNIAIYDDVGLGRERSLYGQNEKIHYVFFFFLPRTRRIE